jgi:hypothetical protein
MADDHSGRAGRGECVLILGVRDEGEVAGLRLLDARNARNLDRAVAFEAAAEPLGELSEGHESWRAGLMIAQEEGTAVRSKKRLSRGC